MVKGFARALLALACVSLSGAFTPSTLSSLQLRSGNLARSACRSSGKFALKMADDKPTDAPSPRRMGASIDADGKSNIWAVEPKIQVQADSENKFLVPAAMVAGLVALLGLLALTPLTNPDQI